jgi:hypothetical protein
MNSVARAAEAELVRALVAHLYRLQYHEATGPKLDDFLTVRVVRIEVCPLRTSSCQQVIGHSLRCRVGCRVTALGLLGPNPTPGTSDVDEVGSACELHVSDWELAILPQVAKVVEVQLVRVPWSDYDQLPDLLSL